jgi:hypothetical protein
VPLPAQLDPRGGGFGGAGRVVAFAGGVTALGVTKKQQVLGKDINVLNLETEN